MNGEIQKKLNELRCIWRQNDIPNISETNTKFLCDLIKIQKTKNMLEIGTANGFSAICFGLELQKNWGKITTIEFSQNSFWVAGENIKNFSLENTITQILWNALDEIPKLADNSFDFIFIDGMKRRTKDFLELSLPKLQTGGIIIIDDVIKFWEKMLWLYDFLESKKIAYNILPIDKDDGVIMIIKE